MYHSLLIAIALLAGPSDSPKFYADDPLLTDADRIDTPTQPVEIELPAIHNQLKHAFKDQGSAVWGEAENINTLDEVPDSAWFFNRHGRQRLSIDELARGPNQDGGPDTDGIWTIFRSKQQGITPGFQIEDSTGTRYVIKFEPRGFPGLSTASEVIATKIFHALGYNVPQNHIAYLKPDNLRIRPGTTYTDQWGDTSRLKMSRVRSIVRKAHKEPDGTIRVLASKYIDGIPIGPFRYHGTRSDDPNDVIDHEQRRELRGLRLIAAWVNHDDTRAHNTQDSWVSANGTHFVKHFLIDFGSCFGSGSTSVQDADLGYHYYLDGGLIKRNVKGFGFHVPTYRKIKWPDFHKWTAIGRWESRYFVPEDWVPNYPNPSFHRMSERDAFWAAKLVMSLSAEGLKAIVATGKIPNSEAQEYFLKTLIERQRKVGDYGLNRLNPIDDFKLSGGRLEFTNLSEKYGLGASGSSYQAQWKTFDNSSGSVENLGSSQTSRQASLSIPDANLGSDRFLAVEIRTENAAHPAWGKAVTVYLRPESGGYTLVGIDRESAPNTVKPVYQN